MKNWKINWDEIEPAKSLNEIIIKCYKKAMKKIHKCSNCEHYKALISKCRFIDANQKHYENPTRFNNCCSFIPFLYIKMPIIPKETKHD